MNVRPALFLTVPTAIHPPKPRGGGTKIHLPTKGRQAERLTPRFDELQRHLSQKTAQLTKDPGLGLSEQVLVLETIGPVQDFLKAVRNVPSLEWLSEIDVDEIAPDGDFFDERNREKALGGRLYFILTNHSALEQFLSLWKKWLKQKRLKGHRRWPEVFKRLKDVRLWGVLDRLEETGVLENWQFRLDQGAQVVHAEIELWYRDGSDQRNKAERTVEKYIDEVGGKILQASCIESIAYHAMAVQLPRTLAEQILNRQEVRLIQVEDIQFFRPQGQVAERSSDETIDECPELPPVAGTPRSPVVALFDGLPIERHELLQGRIIVDDPDGWAETYPVASRQHGTAMASLILHGDLSAKEPALEQTLYVRPVLQPRADKESIPENVLTVDLMHSAVRRMLVGTDTEPPTAPDVKVINLSLGDSFRPYAGTMSPWARLIDWMAWKYEVLFVISAGNHSQELELDVRRTDFESLSKEEKEAAVLRCVAKTSRHRRLLSPAESVNALTVGALHGDASIVEDVPDYRFDPFLTQGLPSFISAQGRGHRRSIKPDILAPGGRLWVKKGLATTENAVLEIREHSVRCPGQLVAAPGTSSSIKATKYSCGTSNAAALVTRHAVLTLESLAKLDEQPGADILRSVPTALWLKALTTHGAMWGYDAERRLVEALSVNKNESREQLCSLLGYGSISSETHLFCSTNRVTLLGGGALKTETGHEFTIPLPPSLSSVKVWRRLTLTLCWFTPINCKHRAYRRAQLWFEPKYSHNESFLAVRRIQAEYRSARRGTVQHEILEGDQATAFVDGDVLEIPVYCRADAGGLTESIPYALVVSLEVAPNVEIPIYDEVGIRIRPTISIQV